MQEAEETRVRSLGQEDLLEKGMATHASILCKRCWFDLWIGKITWRRARLPTPVFLPGESHAQRSLAGYSPWGHTELNTTEATEPVGKRGTRRVSRPCPGMQCKRPGFNPWVEKIPWRRAWQPIPIFLPGEIHPGEQS